MTAWALVGLFSALILKTEDTNCDFSDSFRFGNFGGAPQGILGNPACLLLDPSCINSIHQINKLDLDLKKCDTFNKTGDLTALSVPCLILHGVGFIISFLCNITAHWKALPFNTGRGSLCEHLRSAHTDLTGTSGWQAVRSCGDQQV